ncbi:7894_t:CDS:2 [Cetraspora pellucida]|uniref:7894_t:CDS:1 n=1 Tax=Cetraspora pellucida TaxID=1433469 RepID=A0A9N9NBY2_9GLOM|nr:7894_t:CDS:2 [Cetraspora pellucida]
MWELLQSFTPARIVNVSSHVHRRFAPESGLDFGKLNDPNALGSMQCYGQSKLANILFTNELDKRYHEGKQIYANSLRPGVVDTKLIKERYISLPEEFVSSSITPDDGAITTLYCSTSPEIEEKLSNKIF